jgi:uncharacterized repeat protein (TIGR01451 family)
VTYTINISNSGPNDVVDATVLDTLPADLVGASWTCQVTGRASCVASGSGDINEKVDLPTGSALTYTIRATFGPDANGLVSNSATVMPPAGISDPNLADNSATDTTLIRAIFGNSDKQVQPVNFESGDTLTYTIAIRNESTSSRMVSLVDPIPGNTTYVPGSGHASDGSSPILTGQELIWQGQVTPGVPIYVQFSVTTTSSLSVGAVITNTATLTAEGGGEAVLQVEAIHNPGYLLTINEGANFTNSPEVDLRYSWNAVDGLSTIQFSNDGAFPPGAETSEWLPINSADPNYTGWQLNTYNNYILPRTVYARFKDHSGLIYGPIQDDIIYDPVSPIILDVRVNYLDQGSYYPANDLPAIPVLSATVIVTTMDEHSGVDVIQLSHSASFESFENFSVSGTKTQVPWSLQPTGLVYVRAVDRAGNVSDVKMGQGTRDNSTYLPLILAR